MAAPKQTDPQFKLRLTPEIKLGIEQAAEANGRSMNAEILYRLQTSLEMDSYQPGPNVNSDEAEDDSYSQQLLDMLTDDETDAITTIISSILIRRKKSRQSGEDLPPIVSNPNSKASPKHVRKFGRAAAKKVKSQEGSN